MREGESLKKGIDFLSILRKYHIISVNEVGNKYYMQLLGIIINSETVEMS